MKTHKRFVQRALRKPHETLAPIIVVILITFLIFALAIFFAISPHIPTPPTAFFPIPPL